MLIALPWNVDGSVPARLNAACWVTGRSVHEPSTNLLQLPHWVFVDVETSAKKDGFHHIEPRELVEAARTALREGSLAHKECVS